MNKKEYDPKIHSDPKTGLNPIVQGDLLVRVTQIHATRVMAERLDKLHTKLVQEYNNHRIGGSKQNWIKMVELRRALVKLKESIDEMKLHMPVLIRELENISPESRILVFSDN